MKKTVYILSIFITISFLNASTTTKEETVFHKTSQELEIKQEISQEQMFSNESKVLLKKLLKKRKIPSKLSRSLTKKYYRNFDYKPFWIENYEVKPMAYEFLEIIKDDPVLQPYIHKIFNINKLEEKLGNISLVEEEKLKELLHLDIMLTSTYHQYMRYLSKGIIDWEEFQKQLKALNEEKEIIANWKKYDVRKNIRKLLYKAVNEDNNINLAISEVNYTFPKAQELSLKIKEFEQIAENGGYVKIPKRKRSMKKDKYYPEIKALRQRLFQSGDLKDPSCIVQEEIEDTNIFQAVKNDEKTVEIKIKQKEPEVKKDCLELYDENVYEAVLSFQKNHGLVEDGIIGRNTISRLNVSVKKKIEQMRINLERMRWMPRNLGEKYLLVNIPDFHLKMYNEGEKSLEMEVVVGTKSHPTPIFSHKVSSIVLNPYWRIPQRIVRREIIPELVKDPEYLTKNEIKTFENWSHKSMTYDTSAVDWSMYLDNDLIGNSQIAPMRFIQIPGSKNPLGRMKFMFPNRYSVYLHDTPYKSLFKKRKRAFSHGCIRLSRPNELLETIAKEDEKVDFDKTKEILEDIEKTDFNLSKKIPVHIVYLTSWIDDEGKIQFRDDVYNYDKMQGELLYKKVL